MQWWNELFGDNRVVQIAVLAACGIAVLIAFAIVYRLVFAHRLRVPGGRTRQPRLGLVDAFSLDGQRQLVLIRRDNIEHLVMIGGPNDVLVELQINERSRLAAKPAWRRHSLRPRLASARSPPRRNSRLRSSPHAPIPAQGAAAVAPVAPQVRRRIRPLQHRSRPFERRRLGPQSPARRQPRLPRLPSQALARCIRLKRRRRRTPAVPYLRLSPSLVRCRRAPRCRHRSRPRRGPAAHARLRRPTRIRRLRRPRRLLPQQRHPFSRTRTPPSPQRRDRRSRIRTWPSTRLRKPLGWRRCPRLAPAMRSHALPSRLFGNCRPPRREPKDMV